MTTDYSYKIIDYAEVLESKRKYVLARQILRSGTSIGASVREAQNAESKPDFIHKFKIAAKEADEVSYWLELCTKAKTYPNPEPELNDHLISIIKIISKDLSSSKGK